nr:AAA family ATPase [Flexivirga meconopsidis]
MLNGPPAVGKSTLARLRAEREPMTLCLDPDELRPLLGASVRHTPEGLHAVRELAVAMADTHLRAGHDVWLPQLVLAEEFLDRLAALAAAAGADFRELLLLDSLQHISRRVAARGREFEPTEDELAWYHNNFVHRIGQRPDVLVLQCQEGAAEITYRAIDQALT